MFVSRLLAVQQVRRQMTQIAAQIGQHLRRNELTSDSIRTALAGGGYWRGVDQLAQRGRNPS
jgi:hypothetical protein